MPLDNTASIKDIITSLQNMEGISAKADLASVVGSPASADDTMVTIVNHIQTSKNKGATNLSAKEVPANGNESLDSLMTKIGQIETGKKWASGTSTSIGYILDVSGLDFRAGYGNFTYPNSSNKIRQWADFIKRDWTNAGNNGYVAYYENRDGIYSDDQGFRMSSADSNAVVNWVVFEQGG